MTYSFDGKAAIVTDAGQRRLGAVNVTKAVWPIMREQNYGTAKLGQVGFMNTLKIEGVKNNIHTMTGAVPRGMLQLGEV